MSDSVDRDDVLRLVEGFRHIAVVHDWDAALNVMMQSIRALPATPPAGEVEMLRRFVDDIKRALQCDANASDRLDEIEFALDALRLANLAPRATTKGE